MNPSERLALTANSWSTRCSSSQATNEYPSNLRKRRLDFKPSIPVGVKPTKADIDIAQAIAHHTSSVPEAIGRALAWGADEKLLLVLAAVGWVASRGDGEHLRRAGNHALLVTVASSLIPYGMKLIFDQTRPDRRTVLGHVHGVSFSGKRDDAFPSGHALHMGALASAAGALPPGPRRAIRAIAVGLSITRVAILAGRRMCLPGSRSAWFWSDSFGHGRGTTRNP